MIRWLFQHPLWHYDITYPDTSNLSEEIKNDIEAYLNMDRSKLPQVTVRDGGGFYETVDPEYHYVDSSMERIQTEDSDHPDDRDTAFRVWLEAGGWFDQSTDPNIPVPEGSWKDWDRWMPSHDPRLDCGAPDMESALLELAVRVKFFYTDAGEDRPCEKRCTPYLRLRECDDGKCEDAGDGFCKVCGFLVRARDEEEE